MRSAPKRSLAPTARDRLLGRATKLKLKLSRMLKGYLPKRLKEARARRWQEENREAMEAHNNFIEKHGLFNDLRKRR
jgi:antitoxin CcdA